MIRQYRNKQLGLFPEKYLWIGVGLLVVGIVAGYFYFFGGKPDFFTVPVFAVFTSYAQSRFLVIAQTNLLDEVAAVFSLTGLFLMGFSRVKEESSAVNDLRIASLVDALISAVVIWILLFLLVYGWPIFIISFFIFYLFLLLFFIIFRIRLSRYKSMKMY